MDWMGTRQVCIHRDGDVVQFKLNSIIELGHREHLTLDPIGSRI